MNFHSQLPDVREFVVGPALANLDENGHFRLPQGSSPGDRPIISMDVAGSLALAFIRTWVSNPNAITIPGAASIKETLEAMHGAPVEWERVRLSPRPAYFAESYLEPFPDTIPGHVVRHFGPHFLVPLYVDSEQVATVAVAAYATAVWVHSDGLVRLPTDGGGVFQSGGVPRGQLSDGPISAEEAVSFAATQTGAKIRSVPLLVQPGNRVVVLNSRWRLDLDRRVHVYRLVDGAPVQAGTVYVSSHRSIIEDVPGGWKKRLFVAADVQPTHDSILYATVESPSVEREYDAPIRAGFAVNFHEVEVADRQSAGAQEPALAAAARPSRLPRK